ncbi:Zinc finger RING/FYVE/PHD-type protein [Dioscorea alata]|uniref:Zinc finger RING/FYVE/PHD-type protein n=1 Tax=Dioscorea alata TaxID=55571 RepID=A0ACB7WI10_DIOAL|nr:Zinc finger RING/FYVE/PHD-type protein [Dioscorea alata]
MTCKTKTRQQPACFCSASDLFFSFLHLVIKRKQPCLLQLLMKTPIIDDDYRYHQIKATSGHYDVRLLFPDSHDSSPPPPPSLIMRLNFATEMIIFSRHRNYPLSVSCVRLPPSESKQFEVDMKVFNDQFSVVKSIIISKFMETLTGAALPTERLSWLATDITHFIMAFIRNSRQCVPCDEILVDVDVVHEKLRDMTELDEALNEFLQDEDLNRILQESIEDSELSACPAPQEFLESLVTEVLHDQKEVMKCMVCLEELVAGMEVKRLPCSHCFHGECIDGWFAWRDSCPLCRFKLQA